MRKIKLIETLKKGTFQAKIFSGSHYKYITDRTAGTEKVITGTKEQIIEYCLNNFGECRFY